MVHIDVHLLPQLTLDYLVFSSLHLELSRGWRRPRRSGCSAMGRTMCLVNETEDTTFNGGLLATNTLLGNGSATTLGTTVVPTYSILQCSPTACTPIDIDMRAQIS